MILALSSTPIILSGCNQNEPESKSNQKTAATVSSLDRVLLVGNSYTFANNGVDAVINDLAHAAVASKIAVGGYFLQNHVNDIATTNAITTGNWRYVVLQAQSQEPISNYDNFAAAANKLDDEIWEAGAKTILFMTWQRQDSVSYGVTTDNLAKAYTRLGKQLNVRVAPVGLAFARSALERPDLAVTNPADGNSHPTLAGTYLAGCIFFTMLYGNPVDSQSSDGLNKDDKAFLQRIAVETVSRYQTENPWLQDVE